MKTIRCFVAIIAAIVLQLSVTDTAEAQSILFPQTMIDSIKTAPNPPPRLFGIDSSSSRIGVWRPRYSQLFNRSFNDRTQILDSIRTLGARLPDCPMPIARVDSATAYAARPLAVDSAMTAGTNNGVVIGCTNPLGR